MFFIQNWWGVIYIKLFYIILTTFDESVVASKQILHLRGTYDTYYAFPWVIIWFAHEKSIHYFYIEIPDQTFFSTKFSKQSNSDNIHQGQWNIYTYLGYDINRWQAYATTYVTHSGLVALHATTNIQLLQLYSKCELQINNASHFVYCSWDRIRTFMN